MGAGFGPFVRVWMPRRKHAGTYDAAWEKERQPLPPRDFDERFHQCAPEDQQVPGYLRGGESVELFNLSPSGYLKFALPKVALRFETRLGNEVVEHRAVLHTVVLQPDVSRVTMLWHTALPVHGKKLKIRHTTITQKRYVEL
jgi:hypothetical protein